MGIELTGSVSGSPTASQALQFLTPTQVSATGQTNELGMPIVNSDGQLFDMNAKAINPSQSIRDFVRKQVQPLQGQNTNPLHDAWNRGVTEYYAENIAAAQTDFQKAEIPNPQFQAPNAFLALPPFKTVSNNNGTPNTGANQTPTPGKQATIPATSLSSKQNTAVFGYSVPTIWLIIAGVLLLVVLLLLLSFLFIRRQSHRRHELARFAEEQRTADQKAATDAALIAEQEKFEQQKAQHVQPQQTPINQASAPASLNHGDVPVPLPISDLCCPNCGQPVKPEDNFCSSCRAVLSPSASELQRHATLPPVPAVVPSASISDQPTLQMSPHNAGNGQLEQEKTLPFTVEHLSGRNMSLAVGTRSDPGIKRKHKPNEDSLFAAQGERTHNSQAQQFGLFVVADGMGGHANGQDASRLAIQTIVDRLLPKLSGDEPFDDDALIKLLVDGVQESNMAVHQRNMEHRADMGTTMTAALVVGSTAYIANVGDSRTYLYREPEGLKKITNDHSVVASLVEAGIIKPDDIYTHPKRNQIYRSLGEKPMIDVDSFTVPLQPGDKLLLCSDGLWDMVRDPLIQQVMSTVPDPSQMGNALIKAALDGGGEDNVSVIVVSITEATRRTGMTGIQLLAKPDTVQMPPM
ncbi:MAG: hypothetical protein NVSMB33_12230 [Ktedonobacteraceae bacterium]